MLFSQLSPNSSRPKIKIKNSPFKKHLRASLVPKFTAELYPASERRMGGWKGKWSRTAVFSINSCRKPPTYPTASSTPPAKRREEAAWEIPFLQGGSNWLPGFLNAPTLAEVLRHSPGSIRAQGSSFVFASSLVDSQADGAQEAAASLPSIPTQSPSTPRQARGTRGTVTEAANEKVGIFSPIRKYAGTPSHKKTQLLSAIPCSATSCLQVPQLGSLLFWSGARKGTWDAGRALRSAPPLQAGKL